jgi:molybdenum cofactor guanylyltransferase
MAKKHEKHTKLKKPAIGFYGRNELAFMGAPCGLIQKYVERLILSFGGTKNVVYVDADHGAKEGGIAFATFQDKISHKRFEKKEVNDFDQKFLLNDQDFIFVNGNHFQANKQVVFIHPEKEDSLKKRIGQLTEVIAVVLADGMDKPFDWLEDTIGTEEKILKIEDVAYMHTLVLEKMTQVPLKALILSGGKSTRMGFDKTTINYHGKPQREYLADIFDKLGVETFFSCRADQVSEFGENTITDKFLNLGPYGAILSAFQTDPDAAWLVLASDMPLIQMQEIEFLIQKRNSSKTATACFNPETNFPDPLFTIWEPKAYLSLLSYLTLGYSCPRKVLINSEIELVQLPDPKVLANVNSQEDKAALGL